MVTLEAMTNRIYDRIIMLQVSRYVCVYLYIPAIVYSKRLTLAPDSNALTYDDVRIYRDCVVVVKSVFRYDRSESGLSSPDLWRMTSQTRNCIEIDLFKTTEMTYRYSIDVINIQHSGAAKLQLATNLAVVPIYFYIFTCINVVVRLSLSHQLFSYHVAILFLR